MSGAFRPFGTPSVDNLNSHCGFREVPPLLPGLYHLDVIQLTLGLLGHERKTQAPREAFLMFVDAKSRPLATMLRETICLPDPIRWARPCLRASSLRAGPIAFKVYC